ncbi:MAG: hypothetical protein WCY62_11050 [Clostridia bacterium]|jgi:hypothetical protein
MKKFIFLVFAIILLLTSCTEKDICYIPYDQIPEDYSLLQAKDDDCVVFEDSDITSGQSVWDDFLYKTASKKSCEVRLAFYYTLGDASHYAAELYEEIKDDYPVLYIMDLSYDGEKYTIYHTEDDNEYSNEYGYLVRYNGTPGSPTATYSGYTYYVLVNDDTVTWEQIEHGMYSSLYGDAIDHMTVYYDKVWK